MQDNWKMNQPADPRLRRAARAPAAAVRRAGAGVELPARAMGRRPGAAALRRRVSEQRQPVRDREPAGATSDHGSASRPGHVGGHRYARAGFRQHDQRTVPLGAGHRRRRRTRGRRCGSRRDSAWPTTSPGSRRSWCAAAWACSSTGRTATRSIRRCRTRPPSATSPSATRSCRISRSGLQTEGAPCPERSSNTTAICRRRRSGTRASRWRCRGRRRSTSSTSASTATTRSNRSTSTPIDYGAAFLPGNQDPTLAANSTPGATAVVVRPDARVSRLRQRSRSSSGAAGGRSIRCSSRSTAASRAGWRSASTTRSCSTTIRARRRACSTTPTGRIRFAPTRPKPTSCSGGRSPTTTRSRATSCGISRTSPGSGPDARAPSRSIANDWQLSGVWTAATGSAYTVGFNYQNGGGNVNLTGSPDYGARVRVVGDPGSGCSSDPLQQFTTSAFQGPTFNSVGLESGADYLRGCFTSTLTSRSHGTSASAATATSSCASRCSTRRTRLSLPGGTRR